MKARFNYGDDKSEYVILDVPSEYYYIERLTHISCMAKYADGKADEAIYWDIYRNWIKDVTKLFCKSTGVKMRKGLTAEVALSTSKHKLVFDIVQYP